MKQKLDPNLGIVNDFTYPGETLLVTFAGHGDRFSSMPLFEFVNILADVPAKKVFLRDPQGLWYLHGVPGVGNNVYEVAQFIRELRAQEQVKRMVMVGSSSGGYAAILFGLLASADDVYAFSPQTKLLSPNDIRKHKIATLERAHRTVGSDNPFWDLRSVFMKTAPPHPRVFIYYPRYSKIDRDQAQQLIDFPNVQFFTYPHFKHGVAKILKGKGILKQILRTAVSGEAFDLNTSLPGRGTIIWDIAGAATETMWRTLRHAFKRFRKGLFARSLT